MGGKKKGSARTPHEAPDSLKSAQRLRAIGLISLGPIKGPVNKWKSTFFDNTPIQNENGVDDNDEASFNFKNTEVSFTLGTQDQAPLQGFEMSEREVSVSTEVKYTTPITRTVTDPDVTRLRVTLGVNALYEQNDQGDTNGTSVWFRILINGLPRATYEINGKSSSRFYRSYIVDNLPERPFTVTVERTTTDSKSQRLQNTTNWVSYTEIIDTKLSYPNMALVGIKTDSRYNPNFPNVNFLLYGRLVKVPSTYDPETRTYSTALWKGDWKQAWTNNPAWVFYDLVTDPLAGLGKRVGDYGLDKFQLYQIAKYCDELVDDGYGGKEPRMTANLWLTDQRSAYEVLSDMASVFRAIAVWNGTQFTAIQDRTADPVCTYSQANVIDGKFSRQYAAMKSIYTAAEVEYADERNMYQKAIEYVADDFMIDRYGYNVKKMTAYATTSRGQAHRWGKWVLATSLLEQCTITFSVGRQGLLHLPGDIIEVADNDYAGKTLGGRVVAVNGREVTLDQPIEISGNSYLSYLNDEMKVVKVAISSVDSKNKAVVTLATVPTGLESMDDWVLKTPAVSTQLYRAIGITENDDGSYTITALQHEPQKEAIVDGSASFVPVETTAHTGGAQKVANAEANINENGVKLTWEMPSSNSIVKYEVRLYRNGVLYQTYLDLETTELTFDDLPDGSYVAEIRSKNANGQLSDPVTRAFEINLTINRLTTKSLYFSIQLDWDLPKTATVGNYTEIWRSVDNNISNAKKIATLPYPQNSYILNGIDLNESYYFFVRCGDKAGNKGQFTEGVFGEADHNPDTLLNVLEGQITRSQLGSDLIASLQQDIDTAVAGEAGLRQSAVANAVSQIMAESQARAKAIQDEVKARTAALTTEANNRTKAIQAESASLTKKIQAEATARGTAVAQLQNVDAQQAQLISAVTAKADNALSGLEAEKTARANADKAESQAREALTARVGTAESNIATIQRTVATNAQSISEVSQNLNSKIDNIKVGGRNLLRNSNSNYTGSRYMTNYALAKIPEVGEQVTVTLWGELAEDRQAFGVYNTHGYREFAKLTKVREGVYSATFAWKNPLNGSEEKDNSLSTHFNIYAYPRTATSDNTIKQVKLELGNIATDWTPAPEDVESSIDAVSADLTSYKQTQATKEQAQASTVDGLVTRVAGTESKITNVERSVSALNSSTSTKFSQIEAGLNNAKSDLSSKITAEQNARVNADKANADNIVAITSRIAGAESSISNIQSTKANKNEVASLAQTALRSVWQSDAQSAVDGLQVGGRNLILNSAEAVQNANYLLKTYMLSDNTLAEGERVVITIWGELGADRKAFWPFNSNGYNWIGVMQKVGDGIYRLTTNWKKSQHNPSNDRLLIYCGDNTGNSTSRIDRIKLERGTVSTDWTPAPEDVESSTANIEAKLTTYQQAQAKKDQATTTQLNGLTTRLGSAESNISAIQSTKASKTEVASLAQSSLQAVWKADAQSAVDGVKVGGRNLLRNSNSNYTGSRYMTNYALAKIPEVGEQVTVTLWGELAEDRQAFGVYNTHGYREFAKLTKVREGVYSATFAWKNPLNGSEEKDNSLSTHFNIYAYPRTATSDNTIKQVKLELGNIATDWTPAPEDVESSIDAGKALISQVSNAVAGIDGRLSATHTLKTQAISGGRTAIAGIALGATADNKTTESTVIVMADKFGVVANANDGNVKSVFSVANGQVGIRGDLIADGSIIGEKIRANTNLSAPNINGGNITGTAIEGNTITGGRIQGATIEGNTITGGTVQGTNINGSIIEGGIIRGARIEGLTIEAQNIIGDVVKIYSTRIKYIGSSYDGTVTLTIQPHNKNRNFYLLPAQVLLENRGDFLAIRLNGGEWRTVRGQGYQFISGNFFLPAGQKMDIFIWASRAKADEFAFLSNNA